MWNWQQDNWPEFVWDPARLARTEALFREGAGVVIGASKHLSAEERRSLSIELMSHEAVDPPPSRGSRWIATASSPPSVGILSGQ